MLRRPGAELPEPFDGPLLERIVPRGVELPALDPVRQVALAACDVSRLVVRVPVAPAVAQVLHQAGRRVADAQRDLQRPGPPDLVASRVGCREHRVRLGRHGQVQGGLGQRENTLGHPDALERLIERDDALELLRSKMAEITELKAKAAAHQSEMADLHDVIRDREEERGETRRDIEELRMELQAARIAQSDAVAVTGFAKDVERFRGCIAWNSTTKN